MIKLLLLAPLVAYIQHQPWNLTYLDGDRTRSHVPDFGVTLTDGRQAIVEVKPQKFVVDHVSKFNACAALLRSKQVNYYVCTDEHVSEERIARATEIIDSAKRAPAPEELNALINWVQLKRTAQVQDAIASGFGEALIDHAVGRRRLLTGPSLSLAPGNWLTTQETADELLTLEAWLGCAPWPSHY